MGNEPVYCLGQAAARSEAATGCSALSALKGPRTPQGAACKGVAGLVVTSLAARISLELRCDSDRKQLEAEPQQMLPTVLEKG